MSIAHHVTSVDVRRMSNTVAQGTASTVETTYLNIGNITHTHAADQHDGAHEGVQILMCWLLLHGSVQVSSPSILLSLGLVYRILPSRRSRRRRCSRTLATPQETTPWVSRPSLLIDPINGMCSRWPGHGTLSALHVRFSAETVLPAWRSVTGDNTGGSWACRFSS